MFTGIIEQLGVVDSVEKTAAGMRLRIAAAGWGYRARRGDSVAVNGCCLTAVADAGADGVMMFDAVPETLSKTTLGSFAAGHRVHLEHAAMATTLLGGHIVQGHVDGVGRVLSIDASDGWRVRLGLSAELMAYMAPKGSVCLDGVSLTLAKIDQKEAWIEVALIPVTLEKTLLKGWSTGTSVNVEADVVAKTVVGYLRAFGVGSAG